MPATKAIDVLDNDVTLTAGAGDHTSTATSNLTTAYGATLHVKITNGATGPTVAAQSQVWAGPDNSHFYKLGGPLIATLGNSVITSWSIPIPIGVQYVNTISGSNTTQNVTIRVEVSKVTGI